MKGVDARGSDLGAVIIITNLQKMRTPRTARLFGPFSSVFVRSSFQYQAPNAHGTFTQCRLRLIGVVSTSYFEVLSLVTCGALYVPVAIFCIQTLGRKDTFATKMTEYFNPVCVRRCQVSQYQVPNAHGTFTQCRLRLIDVVSTSYFEVLSLITYGALYAVIFCIKNFLAENTLLPPK
jgi:hypothetical protein